MRGWGKLIHEKIPEVENLVALSFKLAFAKRDKLQAKIPLRNQLCPSIRLLKLWGPTNYSLKIGYVHTLGFSLFIFEN